MGNSVSLDEEFVSSAEETLLVHPDPRSPSGSEDERATAEAVFRRGDAGKLVAHDPRSPAGSEDERAGGDRRHGPEASMRHAAASSPPIQARRLGSRTRGRGRPPRPSSAAETTRQSSFMGSLLQDSAPPKPTSSGSSILLGPLVPPPTLLVHEQLIAQAERNPTRVALVEEAGFSSVGNEPMAYGLTFGQVAHRSVIVSRWLHATLRDCADARLGRHLVGIHLPKCHESMIGYFGILMSGAAYVVLDVKLDATQLRQRLRDLPVSAILSPASGVSRSKLLEAMEGLMPSNSQIRGACGDGRGSVTCLPTLLFDCDGTPEEREAFWKEAEERDTFWKEPEASSKDAVLVEPLHDNVSFDSLACLAMTSGSTGQPKSILAPHRMISNENWARQIALPFAGDEECLDAKLRLFEEGVRFGPDDCDYVSWLQSNEAKVVEERYAFSLGFHWDVPRALGRGVPSYIIPENILSDPDSLVDYLERHRITR